MLLFSTPNPKKSKTGGINQHSITRPFNLKPIPKFDNTVLPSNAAILQRMFYERDFNNSCNSKSIKDIFDCIYPEIEAVYLKIPVKMKRKDRCKIQVLNLYDRWRKMAKNPGQIKSAKSNAFKQELSSLCNFISNDAIDIIAKDKLKSAQQIQEDIAFIKDQMTIVVDYQES